MPLPKEEFDRLHPCEFYEPDELLDPDLLYTVDEIARLLQELDPDAELDPETEAVLVDWAIPWIVDNADDLVVAEPRHEADAGHYGLKVV
ncbi:MAG: DUF5827 family protein [Haloarculaceae archaeon]